MSTIHDTEHHLDAHHQESHHPTEHFLERHWSWLVIAFAVAFVLCIDNFAPVI